MGQSPIIVTTIEGRRPSFLDEIIFLFKRAAGPHEEILCYIIKGRSPFIVTTQL